MFKVKNPTLPRVDYRPELVRGGTLWLWRNIYTRSAGRATPMWRENAAQIGYRICLKSKILYT